MRINITLPDKLAERIKKFRRGVLEINISKICAKSIDKELRRLETKNS